MNRAIASLLAFTLLAGCSTAPGVPTQTSSANHACEPRSISSQETVTTGPGDHNITTPTGSMYSGPYAEYDWAWGSRGPVNVTVQATWQTGIGDEQVYRLRADTKEGINQPLAEAQGTSPLWLNFTVASPPGGTNALQVHVEPANDPNLPAGVAVAKKDNDVLLTATQALLC